MRKELSVVPDREKDLSAQLKQSSSMRQSDHRSLGDGDEKNEKQYKLKETRLTRR